MKAIVYNLIVSFFLICANSNSILAQDSTYLDENSYKVKMTQLSGSIIHPPWDIDTFIFKSGKMYSVRMKREEGFRRALYIASISNADHNPIIKFTYFNSNRGGSTLGIQGTVQGNLIEGTAQWKSLSGENEYTFTGTLLV